MWVEAVDDRAELEAWLARDRALHIYELGDLDPFFWPHTRWFGLRSHRGAGLEALALVYLGAHTPTLLALAGGADGALATLVERIAPQLPDTLYTHLGPGLAEVLARAGYRTRSRADHLKLILPKAALAELREPAALEVLGRDSVDALEQLYARSYPGNWFDPRMLDTGQYVGLRCDNDGQLLAVAGVHVYSPRYGVAALGNVTTTPRARGRGLATALVAGLCARLRTTGVETIGLNVAATNHAALRCYARLGFERLARYEERALSRS